LDDELLGKMPFAFTMTRLLALLTLRMVALVRTNPVTTVQVLLRSLASEVGAYPSTSSLAPKSCLPAFPLERLEAKGDI